MFRLHFHPAYVQKLELDDMYNVYSAIFLIILRRILDMSSVSFKYVIVSLPWSKDNMTFSNFISSSRTGSHNYIIY